MVAFEERERLEEGPILDPAFIRHYWLRARLPSRWAARWIAAKMRTFGVGDEADVLDIGCGPGWTTRYLAAAFPRMRLVGIDLAEPMVRQAVVPANGEPRPPRLHFAAADGLNLPFADGRFDAVLSNATIHHIGKPVALFDEIHRVLAPNGIVLLSDLNREAGRTWLRPVLTVADWIERRMRPPKARELHEGFVNSFKAAYTCKEIREALAQSALRHRAECRRRPFMYWIQTPLPEGGRNERDEQ